MNNSSTPKWREDFPIHAAADDHIVRRDFLRFLAVVSTGLAAGSGLLALQGAETDAPVPLRREIATTGELPPGTWKVFPYPDEHSPALLVHREDGTWVAYLQKCPHLACPVTYYPSADDGGESLRCRCHRGRFDIESGRGVAGPPRELRPLRTVMIEILDERVFAVGLGRPG